MSGYKALVGWGFALGKREYLRGRGFSVVESGITGWNCVVIELSTALILGRGFLGKH